MILLDVHAATQAWAGFSRVQLSPEGAFLSLVGAVVIDTWALGGPRFAPVMDRLAFIGWVACWQVGFAGSGLTGLISGAVTGAFAMVASIWDYPLFVGAMHIGPQILGLVVLAITLGAMAPAKIKFLGRLSNIQFSHLKQVGSSAMARTGMARDPSLPAPSAGWVKKLFPGSVNLGTVALALLFVTAATVITGGLGAANQWGVDRCVQVCATITHPLLAPLGYA